MGVCTQLVYKTIDYMTVAADSCDDACIRGYCVYKSVGAN